MLKFSGNYVKTNYNFTIQNLRIGKVNENEFALFCVLKNILFRGCPSNLSMYMKTQVGDLHNTERFNDLFPLISDEVTKWHHTIKGNEEKNYNPALLFYETIIPKYIDEPKFFQQLILPEAKFADIVEDKKNKFYNSQVDFYCPQIKLVIEIDGEQHFDKLSIIEDEERVEFLESKGIKTIRIKTKDIYAENDKLRIKMNEISKRIQKYTTKLSFYEKSYNHLFGSSIDESIERTLLATSVFRFQILVLLLLENGRINLLDKEWKFRVLRHENIDFVNIAINDLYLWLKNLGKLQNIKIIKPNVVVEYVGSLDECIDDSFVNIDFSILKRWSDINDLYKNVIFIRTDYYDKNNYFLMSISDPIKYNILSEGKDSDLPAIEFLLKNIFGFDKFKPGQLPIIINSLSCKDTLGILPTGSGKSLCYQFSALLQPCVSYIVCPIKSLMIDQRANMLKAKIIRNHYINSNQDGEEKNNIMEGFAKGKYHFIWISPERFQSKKFIEYMKLLNRQKTIALAVIDEVHCLSEWGHDFRTSYLSLIKSIRNNSPSVSLLGLTATASSYVLQDLKIEFEIDSTSIKTLTSFSRPELNFYVKIVDGKSKEMRKKALFDIIDRLNSKGDIFNIEGEKTKAGLIFTLFKNGKSGCHNLSNILSQKYAVSTHWYSGAVPEVSKKAVMENEKFKKYKLEIQEKYKKNEYPLLVATKAFGMGIDKSNIRYTVHYGMPASLESLYQEAGRAGRDGKTSNCYVIHSKEIVEKEMIEKLFSRNTTVEEIRAIQNQVSYSGRDVFENFFLWLGNTSGIDDEFYMMKRIFQRYANQNGVILVECKKLKASLSTVQKALYRLSVLGIVEHWYIEDWNSVKGKLEVYFSDYSIESVKKELDNHISKYDVESVFSYTETEIDYENEYERFFMKLLNWTYDTVVYNRRQSIKTIYERCENFTSSEEFKKEIDSYFKYTDKSIILDNIAFNPVNTGDWFDLFYDKKGKVTKFVTDEEIREIKGSLARYLESSKNNTGLNYISGIVRLFLGEFSNTDGRERLESAFKTINTYDEATRKDVLFNSLTIGEQLDNEDKKQIFSELLCEEYPDDKIKIYQSLNDNYSLYNVINDFNYKLKEVEANLYD